MCPNHKSVHMCQPGCTTAESQRVGHSLTSKRAVKKEVRHTSNKMPAICNAHTVQHTGLSRITLSVQLLSAMCDAMVQEHTLPVMTSAVIALAKPKQANRPLRFCILWKKGSLVCLFFLELPELGHSAAALNASTTTPSTGSISHNGTPVAESSSCCTAPLPVILSLSNTACTISRLVQTSGCCLQACHKRNHFTYSQYQNS